MVGRGTCRILSERLVHRAEFLLKRLHPVWIVQPALDFPCYGFRGHLSLQQFRDQFTVGKDIGEGKKAAFDQLESFSQQIGGRAEPINHDHRTIHELCFKCRCSRSTHHYIRRSHGQVGLSFNAL